MTDHQRIHPVDLEAQTNSTAPLVPQGSARSDKPDPALLPYPPLRQYPPSQLHPPKRRHGNCCCRCICWSMCLLILLVIIIAATAAALYFIFDPKVPKYSVDRFSITQFSVDTNNFANATFDVTVRAENPNKGIGIYYEDGSKLSVLYSDYDLARGSFPAFYQGHKNTTVLTVVMEGGAQLGGQVMNSLQQQQQSGTIPIEFKGDVPVRVKLGALKLWKITSKVRCNLVIDSLTVSSQINIKSSSCKFSFKL
jgi:Late embryogenesis abundant protein